MNISVLASGSNGNSCLVETNKTSLLIDAGKSGREIESRMHSLGKSIEAIEAILITHAHHDHVQAAGILSRKYGMPIYMTPKVHEECSAKIGNGSSVVKYFSPEKEFSVSGQKIKPIPTSHNTPSCGFVIDKFGLFTDTGIVTKEMEKVFPKLNTVLLESNHDIDMVLKGPYPYYLKKWILSDEGHLSNISAGQLIQERGDNLSLCLLGHLSGNNNTPELAKKTFETLVKKKVECNVCSRDRSSGTYSV